MPDIDFLPGMLLGNANRFHHTATHSLGFLLLVAATAYMVARLFGSNPKLWASLVGLSVATHLLLDFFTVDTRAPFGIPLFWPLSARYFLAPHPFFLDIQRSGVPLRFLPSLFSHHNFAAAAREFSLLGVLVALAEIACRTRMGHGTR